MNWQTTLIERLLQSARPDGGWGYRQSTTAFSEPTAIACLALSAHWIESPQLTDGIATLSKLQRSDGGVPISTSFTSPNWPTPLAILAWTGSLRTDSTTANNIRRGVTWLLSSKGRAFPHDPDLFGHDTTLIGWPWIEGTHSWVEPTAYAVAALRAVGRSEHPRVREGVRVLSDRLLPEGGWNYGNTRVLRNTLRPFPATTGVVLGSLAAEPIEPRVRRSIAYLTRELQRIRAPFSLGWGLIGLNAWDAVPEEANEWLAESARLSLARPSNALHDALLLLAAAGWHPTANVGRSLVSHGVE